MEGRRLDRLGAQIREEVSEIISRKLKDPRIGFVTVMSVKVTPDLSYASVYISVMGDQPEIERSIASLGRAASFIRSELGRRLHIKRIPELRFRHDDSCITGARIDSILKRLKEGGNGPGLQGSS